MAARISKVQQHLPSTSNSNCDVAGAVTKDVSALR